MELKNGLAPRVLNDTTGLLMVEYFDSFQTKESLCPVDK